MGQTNDKTKPARRATESQRRAPRFDDARFIQYELDKGELEQCKAWDLDAQGAWDELLALCSEGYSVSLRFDTYSDAYACFVQIRGEPAHVNAGLILTGRGSSPAKAFKQALFKSKAIGPSWVQFAERVRPVIDD